MNHIKPLQLLTMAILDRADAYHWSIQGFGVLRLYVRDLGRIHIWDSTQRFTNTSMIHTHSWDLSSTIVAGWLVNKLYVEDDILGVPYNRVHLLTGYDSKLLADPEPVRLFEKSHYTYHPGDSYAQHRNEIHETDAADGTVSVMLRKEDVDGEADVYWRQGAEWGTAKPRPATQDEVRKAIEKVRWNI